MDIVQLPIGSSAEGPERVAFKRGLVRPTAARPFLRLVEIGTTCRFCAACAAPIESGIVWRGEEAFCSVECSLGGNRLA